jgi:AcrR family transcriptional regulator
MQRVLDAVTDRLREADDSTIRIPEICEETGINYGSVYHHFGSREGVIDEAYAKIFNDMVDEDIARIKEVLSANVLTLEDYLAALRPLMQDYYESEVLKKRRTLRMRALAASLTRPQLQLSISEAQTRVTNELMKLVEKGQELGIVRRDLTSRSIAVLMQAVVFGRSLDDLSLQTVSDVDWEFATGALLINLLNIE